MKPPNFFLAWLETLDDCQLDDLLAYLDSSTSSDPYEDLADWVARFRPDLAKEIL